MRKTALFSVLLVIIMTLLFLIYPVLTSGCISQVCTDAGCFCKITDKVSFGDCPSCPDICRDKGMAMVETSLPSFDMPVSVKMTDDGGFVAEDGPIQCHCYCE